QTKALVHQVIDELVIGSKSGLFARSVASDNIGLFLLLNVVVDLFIQVGLRGVHKTGATGFVPGSRTSFIDVVIAIYQRFCRIEIRLKRTLQRSFVFGWITE